MVEEGGSRVSRKRSFLALPSGGISSPLLFQASLGGRREPRPFCVLVERHSVQSEKAHFLEGDTLKLYLYTLYLIFLLIILLNSFGTYYLGLGNKGFELKL